MTDNLFPTILIRLLIATTAVTVAEIHTRRAAVIPSIRNNKEDGNKLECPQETSDFVRNRIVHFDLKGAPPQLAYYQQLFPLLRQLGATGILLEYEDMFPYHGRLGAWKNRNAYTVDNIRSIINWARLEQLIVIPLVQSFGHLEWILKVEENEQYREDARYPQVICIGNDDAVTLIKHAITQVIAVHHQFGLDYFHIGADEAYQIGVCQSDIDKLASPAFNHSLPRLVINHIAQIANHIRLLSGAKVLAWHDTFAEYDASLIAEYNLGNIIEPVVWKYTPNLDVLTDALFAKLAINFPFIWGASAFKGANGPERYTVDVRHYMSNNLAWIDKIRQVANKFRQFQGLIVTGWQRYDHFSTLCELLPVAVESLAINLLTIRKGCFDTEVIQMASTVLNCYQDEVDNEQIDNGVRDTIIGGHCHYPGSDILDVINRLEIIVNSINTNIYDSQVVRGWMTPYNIAHNYSQSWHLQNINKTIFNHMNQLNATKSLIRDYLNVVFYWDVTDEFIANIIEPLMQKLIDLQTIIITITAKHSFPVRPLQSNQISNSN